MTITDQTHRASDPRETPAMTTEAPPAPTSAAAVTLDLVEQERAAYLRTHGHRVATQEAHDEAKEPRPAGIDLAAVARRLDPGSALAAALRRVAEDPAEADALLQADDAREQREQRERVRISRWESYAAARPAIYESRAYASLLPQMNPKNRVTTWFRSGALNLVLAGHAGHGKTTAAFAVCNEVAGASRVGQTEKPMHVVTWMAGDLMKALRPLTGAAAKDASRVQQQQRIEAEVRRCDLLLLDDLTREAGGDGWTIEEWKQTLHSILDERVTRKRRTIFTLNAKDQADVSVKLVEHYGEPIFSRIKGSATAAWIEGQELRRWEAERAEALDF
jgi:DNA replication protein DnaC